MESNHIIEMIKLKNPYAEFKEYNCFGCSPTNPSGLRMEFHEEGENIVSRWNPGHDHQGFHDLLHGGIQATMMDEIASWVVFMKLDTVGVTLTDGEGQTCSEGQVDYYVLPRNKAVKEMHFPGKEAFYDHQ